jgi:hypothetical protein
MDARVKPAHGEEDEWPGHAPYRHALVAMNTAIPAITTISTIRNLSGRTRLASRAPTQPPMAKPVASHSSQRIDMADATGQQAAEHVVEDHE